MNITQDKPEGKAEVQKELEEGLEVLIQNNIDLILVEVFFYNFSSQQNERLNCMVFGIVQ